ncbi:MAG: hypothetical protein N2C13_04240, partial [Chloroflexota bacterium]
LSYQILPPNLQKKQRPLTSGILIFAILAILNLILAPSSTPPPNNVNFFIQENSPHLLVDAFDLAAAIAILLNLRLILNTKLALLHRTFYAFVIFGVSTIGYATVGMLFQLALPRFISNLLVLIAFISLGYSIARYQSLVDSRISIRDFPVTALSIIVLALVYAYTATQFDLSPAKTALFAALAILTHSAYDLVREVLNRQIFHHEQTLRRELRQLSRSTLTQSMHTSLRRALAILCHNLTATSGFIALQEGAHFLVHSSYHAMPLGTRLDIPTSTQEELFQPSGEISNHAVWVRWVYAGSQPIGLVGVGPRTEMRTYTESDLDWLEDVADQIGVMLHPHHFSQSIPTPVDDSSKLFSTLALQPDAEIVKTVEEGFRNLNDYIKLGDSPLTGILGIEGETHIERGKAVQGKIISTLQTLRPVGDPPAEPLPREWYSFTILHDAYVQDIPDRDIMAKLYISEGTFYRTRRKALRGISRALLEAETLA